MNKTELSEFLLPYEDHRTMSFSDRRDECEKEKFMFGWKSKSNATFERRKAFRCKLIHPGENGERPCRRCTRIHEWKQGQRIENPISTAFSENNTLYMARIGDGDESKKLLYRLRRKKINYLSIPCNEFGGRIYLMDRYDKLSSPVVANEEDTMATFLQFRDKSEWGYFTGNLGKKNESDSDDIIISFDKPDNLNVDVDDLLMNNIQVEATFEIGVKAKLTPENAKEMVTEKFNTILRIIRECGYDNAEYRNYVPVSIAFSKLQETWYAADIGIVTENEIDMYPQPMSWEMKNVADRGLKELRNKNRNFLKEKANK